MIRACASADNRLRSRPGESAAAQVRLAPTCGRPFASPRPSPVAPAPGLDEPRRVGGYGGHRYGGPGVLRLEEVPEPDPGPGEVRVATRAIGINFADLIQRVGHYPRQPPMPFTPGMEASGVVDAVGPGAPPDLVGRRV